MRLSQNHINVMIVKLVKLRKHCGSFCVAYGGGIPINFSKIFTSDDKDYVSHIDRESFFLVIPWYDLLKFGRGVGATYIESNIMYIVYN